MPDDHCLVVSLCSRPLRNVLRLVLERVACSYVCLKVNIINPSILFRPGVSTLVGLVFATRSFRQCLDKLGALREPTNLFIHPGRSQKVNLLSVVGIHGCLVETPRRPVHWSREFNRGHISMLVLARNPPRPVSQGHVHWSVVVGTGTDKSSRSITRFVRVHSDVVYLWNVVLSDCGAPVLPVMKLWSLRSDVVWENVALPFQLPLVWSVEHREKRRM